VWTPEFEPARRVDEVNCIERIDDGLLPLVTGKTVIYIQVPHDKRFAACWALFQCPPKTFGTLRAAQGDVYHNNIKSLDPCDDLTGHNIRAILELHQFDFEFWVIFHPK
jgi:hypothetical protein